MVKIWKIALPSHLRGYMEILFELISSIHVEAAFQSLPLDVSNIIKHGPHLPCHLFRA